MRHTFSPDMRWEPSSNSRYCDPVGYRHALLCLSHPIWAGTDGKEHIVLSNAGRLVNSSSAVSLPLTAMVPALTPDNLGERAFLDKYGLRYACVSGSMANAIASEALVEAMVQGGMLGFFGSAGLAPNQVEQAINRLQAKLGAKSFGVNLIHSPHDSALENGLVDMYLAKGVSLIEASAFMSVTLPLVRFRYHGITSRPDGSIFTPNSVMGKISRLEMAEKFLLPAPENLLRKLVDSGELSAEQAELASQVPVCSEITAEADSGGHTDNRPAISLIPAILALRDRVEAEHGYRVPIGAAGGISTPLSAAGMLAMGVSYVVTGSVNQACLESGSCDQVRQMLAQAGPADCTMAPAADMFEMGVNVQVLKWGTMFPVKARKLYNWYRQYNSIEQLPANVREQIERDYLRTSLEEAWISTKKFFAQRDPKQIAKAEADPKHLMALIFRSYLGQASRWANSGEPTRRSDYQIWCGPSMGTFNEWAKGSFLESVNERRAQTVALNIMYGAAYTLRAQQLRWQGVPLTNEVVQFRPQTPEQLAQMLEEE